MLEGFKSHYCTGVMGLSKSECARPVDAVLV